MTQSPNPPQSWNNFTPRGSQLEGALVNGRGCASVEDRIDVATPAQSRELVRQGHLQHISRHYVMINPKI